MPWHVRLPYLSVSDICDTLVLRSDRDIYRTLGTTYPGLMLDPLTTLGLQEYVRS